MSEIRKIVLPGPKVTVETSVGGRMLSAGIQGSGHLAVCALVDPDAPREVREVIALNTGDTLVEPHRWAHVGTAESETGVVWHVFSSVHPVPGGDPTSATTTFFLGGL